MLSRRAFLVSGLAAAAASGFAPDPVEAALRPRVDRTLSLASLHTGESLKVVYWHDGVYQPSAMRQIARLMRDHYTGAEHAIDPAVIDLLCVLQAKFGKKPLRVVSGYRCPETNTRMAENSSGVASNSLHMTGKAVDIRIDGVTVRNLGRAARSLKRGGVGLYPSSNFVHVDTGHVRYW